MHFARLCFATALALSTAIAGFASAAQAGDRGPKPIVVIPFEQERAKARGDRRLIRLNDDASVIPGKRIRYLPVVNGRMGDRAALDGVELYFPNGRIVSATAEFHKKDATYRHVAAFDRALGPVCAQTAGAEGHRLELRINKQNAISLVRTSPGTSPDAPSFRVTTALDIRHLADEPVAARMYSECKTKRKVVSK